jgi:hypothetical protein
MKHTIIIGMIFLFLLFSKTTTGQSGPDMTFTQMADTLLYPLNKAQITTGILYDRVFPFAGLHAFGALNGNADTTYYGHYRQAHSELYQAAYRCEIWKG